MEEKNQKIENIGGTDLFKTANPHTMTDKLLDGWISVEDRLPDEDNGWALVYFNDGKISGVTISYLCRGGTDAKNKKIDYWQDLHGDIVSHVTHWQPLPKPPKS